MGNLFFFFQWIIRNDPPSSIHELEEGDDCFRASAAPLPIQLHVA